MLLSSCGKLSRLLVLYLCSSHHNNVLLMRTAIDNKVNFIQDNYLYLLRYRLYKQDLKVNSPILLYMYRPGNTIDTYLHLGTYVKSRYINQKNSNYIM